MTDDDRMSTLADIGAREPLIQCLPKNKRRTVIDMLEANSFSSDVSEAIRMIRRISQEYERSANDVESDTMTHSMRMKAVDELFRSHTYAVEMRRAAKSASTWLRSIGRSDGSTDEADAG